MPAGAGQVCGCIATDFSPRRSCPIGCLDSESEARSTAITKIHISVTAPAGEIRSSCISVCRLNPGIQRHLIVGKNTGADGSRQVLGVIIDGGQTGAESARGCPCRLQCAEHSIVDAAEGRRVGHRRSRALIHVIQDYSIGIGRIFAGDKSGEGRARHTRQNTANRDPHTQIHSAHKNSPSRITMTYCSFSPRPNARPITWEILLTRYG